MRRVMLIIIACAMHSGLIAQTFDPQPDFFKNQRELPLVSLNTIIDVEVSSYGAVINDGIDDLTAIQKAIDAAINLSSQSSPVKLIFQQGTYDIMPPSGSSHPLTVANAEYMVIDGQGAEILNHTPDAGAIQLSSCFNVIIKNLNFDYAVLPFTQGVITAVDITKGTFDYEIDPGFPLLNFEYFTTAPQRYGVVKTTTGQLKSGADNYLGYQGWTQISENKFRVSLSSNDITQVEAGDHFIELARDNGKTIFRTVNSKNVTYLNVNIYSSPAGSYNGQDNYELNIINCKVIPKPGRLHSGNADIVHMSGNYTGPWVQDCLFQAYTDDAVNLKYTKRNILSVINPNTLQIKFKVDLSDSCLIYNPRDGVLLGSFSVIKVINLGDNIYQITLSGEHNVTSTGDHQLNDVMYLSNRSNGSFVFRNNTFRNGRRYGMLLQAGCGQVKNCTFENLSSSAIKIENGVDWNEGFVAYDMEIKANTIINCGFDADYLNDFDAGAISAVVKKLGTPCDETKTWCGTETAEWQGLKNITIRDNYIEYNKTGLHLENVYKLYLSDNMIVHNINDPYTQGETSEYIHNCTMQNYPLGVHKNKAVYDEINTNYAYPNPTSDILNIPVDKTGDSPVVSIVDLSGRELIRKQISAGNNSIDLNSLNQGIYVVYVKDIKKEIAKKQKIVKMN